HPFPFLEKGFHLQMVEDRLAVRVDTAQERIIAFFPWGDHAMKHDPVTTFAEIVFEFHIQCQSARLRPDRAALQECTTRLLFSNTEGAENQIQNIVVRS